MNDNTNTDLARRVTAAYAFLDERERQAVEMVLHPEYFQDLRVRRALAYRRSDAILARYAPAPLNEMERAVRTRQTPPLSFPDVTPTEALRVVEVIGEVPIQADPDLMEQFESAGARLNLVIPPASIADVMDVLTIACNRYEDLRMAWIADADGIRVGRHAYLEAVVPDTHYIAHFTLPRRVPGHDSSIMIVEPEEILNAVRDNVAVDCWDGGDNAIDVTGDGQLLVIGTPATHRAVAQFLRALDAVMFDPGADKVEITPERTRRAVERFRATPVRLPARDDSQPTTVSLEELAELLTENTGVAVVFWDDPDLSRPVTYDLPRKETTLLAVLDGFAMREIGWRPVSADVVVIGPSLNPPKRQMIHSVRGIDLRSNGASFHPVEVGGFWIGDDPGDLGFDEPAPPWEGSPLTELIQTNISPDSWATDPGCTIWQMGDVLLTSQLFANAELVDRWLARVREDARADREAEAEILLSLVDNAWGPRTDSPASPRSTDS